MNKLSLSPKKWLLFALAVALAAVLSFGGRDTGASAPQGRPIVLVTLSPYRDLVQTLVGDYARVKVLVPPGVSGHDYEPNPKHTLEASQAVIWFRIGESFETQALNAFLSHNPQLQVVDLRGGLPLLPSTHHHPHDHSHDHHHEEYDTHIWLSPALMKTQMVTIGNSLQRVFPEIADQIQTQQTQVVAKLQTLHEKLLEFWREHGPITIFVAHPAFSYYCHEYGLEQIALEVEGREPTPQEVTRLLRKVRDKNLKKIFVQQEYAGKGTRVVAEELKVEIVMVDPFDSDYLTNMLAITQAFAGIAP